MLKKCIPFFVITNLCLSLSCDKIRGQKGDDGGTQGGFSATPKIDLSMTADELCEKYAEPKLAMENSSKLENKRIELTGTIFNYTRDRDGGVILYFDAGAAHWVGIGKFISCRMKDPQPWLVAHPGQQVQVVGIVQRYAGHGVRLDDCQITQTSGPRLTLLDASDLEARYESDMASLKKQVFKKRYFVEGMIIEGKDSLGKPVPVFATQSKHPVAIHFQNGFYRDEGKMKFGEKGRVLAVVDGFEPNNPQVLLTDAIVISGGVQKK